MTGKAHNKQYKESGSCILQFLHVAPGRQSLETSALQENICICSGDREAQPIMQTQL